MSVSMIELVYCTVLFCVALLEYDLENIEVTINYIAFHCSVTATMYSKTVYNSTDIQSSTDTDCLQRDIAFPPNTSYPLLLLK